MQLRARVYSTQTGRPVHRNIPVRFAGLLRWPMPQHVLAAPLVQPWIHDIEIILLEGDVEHVFRLFFKWHKSLPVNRSISATFRGDALIVRVGRMHPDSFVNLISGDARRADYIMRRYVPFCCLGFRG